MNTKRAASEAADVLIVIEETKLADFKSKYNNIFTEENFVEYAIKCVQVAFNKYIILYTEDVHLIGTPKALPTCKVFDILFLQSRPSVDECNKRLIDKLIHLAFPEFDPVFLQELKKYQLL